LRIVFQDVLRTEIVLEYFNGHLKQILIVCQDGSWQGSTCGPEGRTRIVASAIATVVEHVIQRYDVLLAGQIVTILDQIVYLLDQVVDDEVGLVAIRTMVHFCSLLISVLL